MQIPEGASPQLSATAKAVVQDCDFPAGPGSMALARPCFLFLMYSYRLFLQEDRRRPAAI